MYHLFLYKGLLFLESPSQTLSKIKFLFQTFFAFLNTSDASGQANVGCNEIIESVLITTVRAVESLAGASGKFFLGGPISNIFPDFSDNPPPPRQLFREKNFPDEYDVIALQQLYLNFSYQISLICPKKQMSCPLRGNISSKKMTGAQQKISRGPRTWGSGEIPPPPPCPPLSAVLVFVASLGSGCLMDGYICLTAALKTAFLWIEYILNTFDQYCNPQAYLHDQNEDLRDQQGHLGIQGN